MLGRDAHHGLGPAPARYFVACVAPGTAYTSDSSWKRLVAGLTAAPSHQALGTPGPPAVHSSSSHVSDAQADVRGQPVLRGDRSFTALRFGERYLTRCLPPLGAFELCYCYGVDCVAHRWSPADPSSQATEGAQQRVAGPPIPILEIMRLRGTCARRAGPGPLQAGPPANGWAL